MKLKRNYSTLVFFSMTLLIFVGCRDGSQQGNNTIADDIVVKWRLIDNNIDGRNQFRAAFTLENNGKDTLGPAGWSLYFNYRHRVIESSASETARIRFINGNFYQLSPTDKFALPPGTSITIEYDGRGRMIKDDRAPAGLYFVFTDKDDNETAVASVSNYSFKPLEARQVSRNTPTPESRFRENERLNKLDEENLIPIIPTPREIQFTGGLVELDRNFRIHYQTGLKNKAVFLADALAKILGQRPGISENEKEGPKIILLKAGSQNRNNSTSEGAYLLEVSNTNGITINGNDHAGVFYGIQSFLALLPPNAFKQLQGSVQLKSLSVKDAPRFPYRGMHLDVSRNFNTKEAVFKLLDVMAFYKLNKFHFHLADDEGWRLQIEELPGLTEIGGFRGHTLDEAGHLQPSYGSGPYPDPGISYGSGYYSREDYKEIIRYAHDRHIEVIPEFDVPGHARAAIKSMEARYARLMKAGKDDEANEYLLTDFDDQSEYMSAQRYTDNVISVCRESTYRFFEAVVDDVLEMHQQAGVPLHTIHMGGDEVPEGSWEKSPICDQFIKENDLAEDNDLINYFLNRLTHILAERNLNMAGWQEIAIERDENGENQPKSSFAGQNVIIYSWDNFTRGNQDIGYKVANAGLPVVLCNSTNLYFELAYNNDPAEPGDYFAGFVNTRKAYEFIPMDFLKSIEPPDNRTWIQLDPAAHENILGMQGHLWSEPIKGPDSLEYFYAPKLLGLAERAWAPQPGWAGIDNRTQREKAFTEAWNAFANTVGQREMPRLDYLFGGLNYRLPLPGAVLVDGMLHANVEYPGLTIRYTTDGSDPTSNSEIYLNPVSVEGEIKLRTFDTRGRGSRISRISSRD